MRARFITTLAVLALASAAAAYQEGGDKAASGDTKTADRQMYDALRQVIITGRDLFNKQGDYSGCYRVFQGSLITAKPLLGHRPDLQKAIDKGLADAEKLGYMHERAFALRKVLDTVRAGLKPGEAVTEVPEKVKPVPPPDPGEDKKTDEKKGDEKKGDGEKKAEKAKVVGKVIFKGEPLPGGTVRFNKAKDEYVGKINADGTYQIEVPVGSYTIAIETASAKKEKGAKYVAIPEAYADPLRSGLTVEVRAGTNNLDFELK